jgi:secretion/DNA translocation related TadE-like protein
VAVVGWLTVLIAAGWMALLAAAIAAAQHRLDSAADLAALTGASAVARGDDGCLVVARIAARNGASVRSCSYDDGDVVVTLASGIDLPLGADGSMTSTARAGP